MLRSRLSQEFGRGFEVSSTGHYLVVHPLGQSDQWSKRFEELYRSFVHYFSVRGLKLKAPEFPLVAIALNSRDEFLRYAARDGANVGQNVLGYYSPQSNRIALYDVAAGNKAAWHYNAETIIHEAAHQTAFNTGVHNRFSPPPRWVAEGLGMLFEAPGVWNARYSSRSQDRINPSRLAQFRQRLGRRKVDALANLIGSDRAFQSDPEAAYAEAWAFTYFLVETRPRDYSKYLAVTAAKPDFQLTTSAERMADFTAVFGKDLKMLDALYRRFIASLQPAT
jgi:hypothetical protein